MALAFLIIQIAAMFCFLIALGLGIYCAMTDKIRLALINVGLAIVNGVLITVCEYGMRFSGG